MKNLKFFKTFENSLEKMKINFLNSEKQKFFFLTLLIHKLY